MIPCFIMRPKLITIVLLFILFPISYKGLTRFHFPYTGYSYHPDEGVWMAAGNHYFQKYFIERDWSYSTWADERFGDFGTANPPVGKYIIGASLFMSGAVNTETVFRRYEFSADFDWGDVWNKKPPELALQKARLPNQWLAIECLIVFFLLVKQLANSTFVAFTASTLFILQPLVLEYSHRAMMDIPMLFFSLTSLLIATQISYRIFEDKFKKLLIYAILLGIVLGLAISTKLNALLILSIAVIWIFIGLIWKYGISITPKKSWLFRFLLIIRQDNSLFKFIANFTVLCVISILLVFVILNPFLHHKPIRNALHIWSLGKRVANYDIPEYYHLDTWEKRWHNLIETGLEKSGVFSYWFYCFRFDKILVLLGLTTSIIMILQSKQMHIKLGAVFLLIWFLVTFLGTLLWTHFSWESWYVPMTPLWAILEAFGLLALIQTMIWATKYFWTSIKGCRWVKI